MSSIYEQNLPLTFHHHAYVTLAQAAEISSDLLSRGGSFAITTDVPTGVRLWLSKASGEYLEWKHPNVKMTDTAQFLDQTRD